MSAQRQQSPNDVTIAVVGDGFGALLVYTTAVYLGFKPEQIGIFGEQTNPVATYQQFAWNLGQTVLRSESESHFLPADWPTFAQLDAYTRRSPAALARSVRRKFNPGVPEILTEAAVVTRNLGYPDRVLGGSKVGWVAREPGDGGGPPYFSLYDEDARLLGRARHVMIAVGHGPLAFPGVYGPAREDPEIGERVVQAYEPKTYFPGGRYLVVGSGIAAVNEWVNVLEAGAQCIAMRRNPEPEDQDLNVPRCLFDGSGIDAFQGLSFDQRMDFLGQALRGTSPSRRNWSETIRAGAEQGRFEEVIGEATEIRRGHAGLGLNVRLIDGREGTIDVTGVICATGFEKSALALPVIRRLAQTYDVPIHRERVRLKTNCGVPPLDRDDSRLCMMGLSANTVVPNGDTIAGLKYIARRFVGDVARAEGLRTRSFPSRLKMQMGLARKTVSALRDVHETEQLA
ncbi:MAG: hypothetical protein KDB58_11620 [Solirubrobacterales bacterium]|nr:hypothetical protein [Solirubrobacterales bacterium]MCB8971776.1 hypothetical protein [Thermoleophilales bacterium]MCO5327996.1 hypothetical protein [Solirubrobacterales bacterium]